MARDSGMSCFWATSRYCAQVLSSFRMVAASPAGLAASYRSSAAATTARSVANAFSYVALLVLSV